GLKWQGHRGGAGGAELGGEPWAGVGGFRRDALGAGGALHRAAAGDVMADQTPTVHASAVLAGARAVLIRGPAGAGKSQLALALIQAADTGLLRFARLVGDDRVHLEAHHGRLLVRPAAALAGLVEGRGLRLRPPDHPPLAGGGLVVRPARHA